MKFKTKKIQLFLLHFAGGSAHSFDFLKEYLDKDIEFIALELPGRGNRYKEKLLKTKAEAIEDYYHQIKKIRNSNPYLIYGHSMGAIISLSVVAKLEKDGDFPIHLIVTGNPGPGIRKENAIIRYNLEDNYFKEELKKLGGVPLEVLENQELYEYFSPIMRADFECVEKFCFSEEGLKIETPIHAIMGSEENTNNMIQNWKNFTNSMFGFEILNGNHFFILSNAQQISNKITTLCLSFLKNLSNHV